ncbi:ABC transporter ATP-binding protein [Plantactinospora veratri]|uniref:ABC transporter ATP-binding protein n=1 Tax=Plantactinospora veratri TaxID=1436122 RepID=A0ABU7SG27_9ACTN
MTVISAYGLRKTYGGRVAVDGIDLTVDRGEVFALLGPNGAGKTSTIEILEGYRRRDGGTVSVLGEDPGTAGRRWRARIGIVLQTATDAAELTVRETVRHLAGYYPEPRDPDEVIEVCGLAGKAGARIRTLSGGQRRRLDVALGIVGRPELLFLDEPTTGFDPEARRQFWTLIRRLADEGGTILLTTHYLDEAEALAGRLAVLAGGRIIAEGRPETIGGRATATATVTWRDADGDHREQTPDPAALVARLTARAGGTLTDLRVHRPSLEDVYLDLIGERR